MKQALVIVQDVPTQFDVPLYNKIADEVPFALLVIYTQASSEDAEIGQSPKWDHIKEHRYQHCFLNRKQRRGPDAALQRILTAQPTHVIVSGYWPKLHRDIMKALKRRGVSVGLRSDNTLKHSNLRGIKGVIKRLYLNRLLATYDQWHPVGQQAADYLLQLSAQPRPVHFFPYNVDCEWFRTRANQSRLQRDQHLSELGWSPDSYIVLGIMKWSEREDPLTLLNAFQHYQTNNSKARLVLIGDGPLRDQVKTLVAGLGNVVITPGYVSYSQLPHWYGLADVFVHPAPGEPWGVSVAEALACGVAVIASTGVGAAQELLQTGHTGEVFEECNVGSLVAALTKWQLGAANLAADELRQRCFDALSRWNYGSTIQSFKEGLQHV